MINETKIKNYCCEDISLIENYALAIADHTQTWDCHHRGEILPCGRFSPDDLNKFGLYYKRPASELIFLPHDEHASLHHKGVPRPDLKGVPFSEEHKQKLSKKILQFTKSGEFVREWASAMEAQRELGIAQSSICKCCKGKLPSAGGYVWKYVV